MKLVTNKDFIKEYKNDAWRGFTLSELITIVIAFAFMILFMYVSNRYFSIPLATAVYMSVPMVLPIVAVGFGRYQEMSVFGFLREYWYTKKTEKLFYEGFVLPPEATFTMASKPGIGISAEEMKKRKKQLKERRKRGRKNGTFK